MFVDEYESVKWCIMGSIWCFVEF